MAKKKTRKKKKNPNNPFEWVGTGNLFLNAGKGGPHKDHRPDRLPRTTQRTRFKRREDE